MAVTYTKSISSNTVPLNITPRSWLFVPATRPDRFAKAARSGADAIIIDLEDSISHQQKQQAQQNVAEFFAVELELADLDVNLNKSSPISKTPKAITHPQIWIRPNNLNHCLQSNSKNTPDDFIDELEFIAQLPQVKELAGIILPKVTHAEQISLAYDIVEVPVIAQIESAQGLMNLADIARAEGVYALSYGKLDLCNELNIRAGTTAANDFFTQLRLQLLLVSKTNNLIAPIESINANCKDCEGLTVQANYVADLGFAGMLCIHPSQVEIVNHTFMPTAKQLAFAQQVINHYEQTGDSIFAIDGVMVDLPVIRQCQRLLAP